MSLSLACACMYNYQATLLHCHTVVGWIVFLIIMVLLLTVVVVILVAALIYVIVLLRRKQGVIVYSEMLLNMDTAK